MNEQATAPEATTTASTAGTISQQIATVAVGGLKAGVSLAMIILPVYAGVRIIKALTGGNND